MKRHRGMLIIGLATVVLAIAAVASLQLHGVQDRLLRLGAQAMATPQHRDLFDDQGLRVAICGSSSPMVSKSRAKPCVAVFAGGAYYLVDVGPESVENLMSWHMPLGQVGGVFITHFHSDHIGELGEFNLQSWIAGRPGPLPIFGPEGVDRVVAGFAQAYAIDQGYRTAHHGAVIAAPQRWPMEAHTIAGTGAPANGAPVIEVLNRNGLRVTAIAVDHRPAVPALAYRFDYGGRSIVVSGDTGYYPPLAQFARGADVLIQDAMSKPMIATLGEAMRANGADRYASIMRDIPSYHASPTEAAKIAADAHVRLLVLNHLAPAPDNLLTRSIFARGIGKAFTGDWLLADDGLLVALPRDRDLVVRGRMN